MSDVVIAEEVERSIVAYENAIGRPATRTRQMISDHGEIGALSRLMDNAQLQQGFKALRGMGRLNETFEATIVRHPQLFDETVVAVAQFRLDHPFDLE